MIDSKELRIGNKILRMGNVVTVSTIDDCREEHYSSFLIGNYEDLASYSPKEYEPIPLTPEMLERCGFEEIYKSDFTIRFDYKLNGKIGAGWNLINGHFHVRYIGEKFTHVKQLHQLQNLYFALTGEELEIKELQQA